MTLDFAAFAVSETTSICPISVRPPFYVTVIALFSAVKRYVKCVQSYAIDSVTDATLWLVLY